MPLGHSAAMVTVPDAMNALCLAYVLWLPVSQENLLYPALALLAAVSVLDVLTHRTRVSPTMLAGVLLLMVAVGYGLVVGTLRDSPGVAHQGTVWGAA